MLFVVQCSWPASCAPQGPMSKALRSSSAGLASGENAGCDAWTRLSLPADLLWSRTTKLPGEANKALPMGVAVRRNMSLGKPGAEDSSVLPRSGSRRVQGGLLCTGQAPGARAASRQPPLRRQHPPTALPQQRAHLLAAVAGQPSQAFPLNPRNSAPLRPVGKWQYSQLSALPPPMSSTSFM